MGRLAFVKLPGSEEKVVGLAKMVKYSFGSNGIESLASPFWLYTFLASWPYIRMIVFGAS